MQWLHSTLKNDANVKNKCLRSAFFIDLCLKFQILILSKTYMYFLFKGSDEISFVYSASKVWAPLTLYLLEAVFDIKIIYILGKKKGIEVIVQCL